MIELGGVPHHGSIRPHRTELAVLLHRGAHVARAQQQIRDLIRDLLTEAAATSDLRDDVAPDELASYCLHALTAASSLPSKAAVRRLVAVILDGLQGATSMGTKTYAKPTAPEV